MIKGSGLEAIPAISKALIINNVIINYIIDLNNIIISYLATSCNNYNHSHNSNLLTLPQGIIYDKYPPVSYTLILGYFNNNHYYIILQCIANL